MVHPSRPILREEQLVTCLIEAAVRLSKGGSTTVCLSGDGPLPCPSHRRWAELARISRPGQHLPLRLALAAEQSLAV